MVARRNFPLRARERFEQERVGGIREAVDLARVAPGAGAGLLVLIPSALPILITVTTAGNGGQLNPSLTAVL